MGTFNEYRWNRVCYISIILKFKSMVLRVRQKGKCQGRMVELVPRDSFEVIQGCTNSGPGILRIPGVTQTDRLVFSLYAAPLEIVRSCISKWHGQNHSRKNGGPEYSRPERGGGT